MIGVVSRYDVEREWRRVLGDFVGMSSRLAVIALDDLEGYDERAVDGGRLSGGMVLGM